MSHHITPQQNIADNSREQRTEIDGNYKTRQSEMAKYLARHKPVLGNVHPIKIEKKKIFFRDVISLLGRVFISLIDTATQEVPMKNI